MGLDFVEILDKCLTDILTVLHNCHAAAQAVANPAQPAQARPSLKPSTSELKPKKLSHDTTLAIFRTWKKIVFGPTMTPLSSVPSYARNNRHTSTITWTTSCVPGWITKLPAQLRRTHQF